MRTYLCEKTGKWITEFAVAGVREEAAAVSRDQSLHIAIERLREIVATLLALTDYLSGGAFA